MIKQESMREELENDEEEDFMKIAELQPDIHYANIILKVHQIEAIIV